MRLGDLDALKEDLKRYFTNGEALYQILTIIDNAPTVEPNEMTQDLIDKVNVNVGLAQPIKDERPQGEWLKSDVPESILAKCSLCGFDCGAYTHNYCPHCGADMRKGSEEE